MATRISGSPSMDKCSSYSASKFSRPGVLKNADQRASSASRSLSESSSKAKDKRPRSCGESYGQEKITGSLENRSIIETSDREVTWVKQEQDEKSMHSRSPSISVRDSENAEKRIPRTPAITKTSTSGIPLPKKQTTSNKLSSPKQSPRPISKSKLRRSPSQDLKGVNSCTRRGMELQFALKKKRLETMKKELIDKQKPILEEYQKLLQLKKRLDESGRAVQLEEIKFMDWTQLGPDFPRAKTPHTTKESSHPPEGEVHDERPDIDPHILKGMKEVIELIPQSLLEICRTLMTRRSLLIDILERNCHSEIDTTQLQNKVDSLKLESVQLERKIETTFKEQEQRIEDVIHKLKATLEMKVTQKNTETITEMEQQLAKQQLEINRMNNELRDTKHALERRPEKMELARAEETIQQLTNQVKVGGRERSRRILDAKEALLDIVEGTPEISTTDAARQELEGQLANEKKNIQTDKDLDRQLKTLKTKLKEIETKKHEAELKANSLQKTIRQKEDTIKNMEKTWENEKQELIRQSNQDKQLLNKLTKDRGFLETRVKTLAEFVEENETSIRDLQEKCKEEVRAAKQELEEERLARETMEKKYEYMRQEFFKMEVTNQQAIDLVVTKKEGTVEGTISTEREAELYTELLATRVALKAAEDKVKNYAREKLRFIDTIERLSSNSENNVESLAASLVQKEEEITNLERKVKQSDDIIQKQKMEIANLAANVNNMEQRLAVGSDEENYPTRDIHGEEVSRIKMDETLKKLLDYEQKVIKYEHDIELQQNQLSEMDNLLKVRDGLIGMLKAKKDELFVENESLTKYANEIRDALLETKQELTLKQDEIQQLFAQLEQKSKMLIKQDKKIKDLKDTLSSTNEKRYKLQDTLGAMEKELQSTKAHVSRMSSEIQARYEFGIQKFGKRSRLQRGGHSHHQYQEPISLNDTYYSKGTLAADRQSQSTIRQTSETIVSTFLSCNEKSSTSGDKTGESTSSGKYVPSDNALYCSEVLKYKFGADPFQSDCTKKIKKIGDRGDEPDVSCTALTLSSISSKTFHVSEAATSNILPTTSVHLDKEPRAVDIDADVTTNGLPTKSQDSNSARKPRWLCLLNDKSETVNGVQTPEDIANFYAKLSSMIHLNAEEEVIVSVVQVQPKEPSVMSCSSFEDFLSVSSGETSVQNKDAVHSVESRQDSSVTVSTTETVVPNNNVFRSSKTEVKEENKKEEESKDKEEESEDKQEEIKDQENEKDKIIKEVKEEGKREEINKEGNGKEQESKSEGEEDEIEENKGEENKMGGNREERKTEETQKDESKEKEFENKEGEMEEREIKESKIEESKIEESKIEENDTEELSEMKIEEEGKMKEIKGEKNNIEENRTKTGDCKIEVNENEKSNDSAKETNKKHTEMFRFVSEQRLLRRRSLPNISKQERTKKKRSRSNSPRDFLYCRPTKSSSDVEETIFRLNVSAFPHPSRMIVTIKEQDSSAGVEDQRKTEREAQDKNEQGDQQFTTLKQGKLTQDTVGQQGDLINMSSSDGESEKTNFTNEKKEKGEVLESKTYISKPEHHELMVKMNKTTLRRISSSNSSVRQKLSTPNTSLCRCVKARSVTSSLERWFGRKTRPSSAASTESRFSVRETKSTQTNTMGSFIVVTQQEFLEQSYKLSQSIQSLIEGNFKALGENKANSINFDRPQTIAFYCYNRPNENTTQNAMKKSKSVSNANS